VSSETLRLAAAQVEVSGDVPDALLLEAAGRRVHATMAEAAAAGARIVQFPEGTLTYPDTSAISATSPTVGEAAWDRVDWSALRWELEAVAAAAAELGVWTVVGAPHRLSDGRRPHNSLFVFSDRGELVTRYDKRRLSPAEVAHLYTPGSEPVVVEVDGFRFGALLCLEILFPELVVEYAAMDVDAVLVSSAPSPAFGLLARAHAVMNVVAVSLAVAAQPDDATGAPSGICTLDGWLGRLPDGSPGLVVADVPRRDPEPSFHRRARSGLYDGRHADGDPRSADRRTL
jgi:predicted amidohydrolase